MILSLNYMSLKMKSRGDYRNTVIRRPDLLCTAMLLKARGAAAPLWWNDVGIQKLVEDEIESLPSEIDWRTPMAKLLGLDVRPEHTEKVATIWRW